MTANHRWDFKMSHYSAYVQRAKALAHEAHAGQTDKAGEPYINHVARVAAAGSDDPLAECVAWLHDVEEDCPDYRWALRADFPWPITRRVMLLTRDGTDDVWYYERIKGDAVALRVKLADIADNSDPARLAKVPEVSRRGLIRTYAKARRLLGVES